jgi:hypothetical protein
MVEKYIRNFNMVLGNLLLLTNCGGVKVASALLPLPVYLHLVPLQK